MSSTQESLPRPCVTLPQGRIRGIVQTDHFPQPVEDLRFRPPVKVKPSDTIIHAVAYGKASPGKPLIPPRIPLVYSEDCLTVNVFRPIRKPDDTRLLPVAIYVHGGAFNRGHSSSQNTASMVAWSEEPFVGVSFNYRVGALGFLASSKAAEEGALNLGMQDQRLLLDWVQENIHHFGGDKHNVTLIGLSAGAITIGHFMLHYSDQNPGPFHRVILESASPTTRDCRSFNSEIIEKYFNEFLGQAGCPQNLSATDTFNSLRALPLSTIIDAQEAVFTKYKPTMQWAFRPVIDGNLIPRPPIQSWRSGQYYKVPIMTGYCTNEGSLYVDRQISKSGQFTDFMQTLLPGLPKDDIERLNELYPDPSLGYPDYRHERVGKDLGPQYKRTETAYGQFALIAPVRQTAHLASSVCGSSPVYLYHWDVFATLYGGAAHGDTARYETFDHVTTSLSPAQKEVSGTFHAYMTSFICNNGDPNKVQGAWRGRPTWQPYTPDQPFKMILGKGNRDLIGGPVGTPAELTYETEALEQCKFWWDRTAITQQ
ncbi:triacylglycerol lipase [Exophiala viscosa]|uniref:Carboxylic ester hydrolase n=1 Tax=Exophiala viscosa TaxID=2486360 RepID=A0AAN6IH59_9EURO|nr:triacylglycerol lipase [Exophiala viscosa]KAI1626530.1 triacylglycerol lipase [Exophiala viscosa]